MTVPQQPLPQNPNPQQQPQQQPQPQSQPGYGYVPQTAQAPQPVGRPVPPTQPAPQYAQPAAGAPQQPAPGYGYAPQQPAPGYGVQPGYGQQPAPAQKPNFLDTLDVAKTTKDSLIAMIVFLGIDLLQSLISLMSRPGLGYGYGGPLDVIIGFSPWVYLTLALALFVVGLHVAGSVKWYRTTGFVLLAAGSAVELLLQILWACHVYGTGTSLLSFLVYAALLAHAVVLFVAYGQRG